MDTVLLADDLLRQAARLGFQGVELTVTRDRLRDADRETRGLRSRADASGMRIHALIMGEHNAGGIAHADTSTAADAARDIRMAIDFASAVGADAILVPFFLEAELLDQAAFDRCAGAFRALCPIAVERGVSLCFEGLLPAERLRELAARVDSNSFGCYFDLANPLMRGMDPATELRATGTLVRRVHMKDMLARPRDARPGEGRVDYGSCAKALAEIGYNGWITLETPAGPPPFVARDLSYTRKHFPITPEHQWPRFTMALADASDSALPQRFFAAKAAGAAAIRLEGELLNRVVSNEVTATQLSAAMAAADLGATLFANGHPLVGIENSGVFVRRCLEVGSEIGAQVVSVRAGTATTEKTPAADWGAPATARLDETLAVLTPVAESTGMTLALSGFATDIVRTTGQAADLLRRNPSNNVRLVCDPCAYISSHVTPAIEAIAAEFLARGESAFAEARIADVGASGAENSYGAFGGGLFSNGSYLRFLREQRPDLNLVLENVPTQLFGDVAAQVCALAEAAPLYTE